MTSKKTRNCDIRRKQGAKKCGLTKMQKRLLAKNRRGEYCLSESPFLAKEEIRFLSGDDPEKQASRAENLSRQR